MACISCVAQKSVHEEKKSLSKEVMVFNQWLFSSVFTETIDYHIISIDSTGITFTSGIPGLRPAIPITSRGRSITLQGATPLRSNTLSEQQLLGAAPIVYN